MKKSVKGVARKVLASALSAAMVVAFAPAVAWGEDPVPQPTATTITVDASASGESGFYSSLSDALSAASQLSGEVVITMNSNVTWETGAAHGSTPLIPAESQVTKLTIIGNNNTFEATGVGVGALRAANGATIAFKNMKIVDSSAYQYENGENAWEFTYLEFAGKTTFENVDFDDGVLFDGESVECFNCTFSGHNNDSSDLGNTTMYGAWVASGSAGFESCTFSGTRGLKVHEAYGTNVGAVVIDGCVFSKLSEKPGIAIGDIHKSEDLYNGTPYEGKCSLLVKGCTFDSCQPGDGANDANAGVKCFYETDTPVGNFAFEECGNLVKDAAGSVIATNTARAVMNGTEYSSVAAAIEASTDNAAITIMGHVTDGITVPEGKKVTIDLNGFTVTNTSGHAITNNGELTVTGTGIVDGIKHATAALYNAPGATATLNGGTFTRSLEAGTSATESGNNSFYTLKNFGALTVNSGVKVNQGSDGNGKFSSLVANGWYSGGTAGQQGKEPAVVGDGAAMTINGGTFNGGLNTIKNDDYGTLTITGGTFQNYAQFAFLNANVATITGGEFISEGTRGAIFSYAPWNETYGKGELTITGGTFSSQGDDIIETDSKSTAIKVSGGTFSANPSDYVIDGYEATESNGQWTVAKKPAVVPDPAPIIPTPTPTPEPPAPEVGDTDQGVVIGGGSSEAGSTEGSTTVDITVTDTTPTTDSKGNKVDGTVSIDKIETTGNTVEIPETITTESGTFLVTSIPAEALKDNTTVTTVEIPASVTSIGESAFAGCTNLTSVTVPAGVTTIEANTFANCENLTTVEIQGDVTSIAPSAFEGCSNLESVEIPDTVTSIGEAAFAGCSSLTSTTIPAGVTTIGSSTFAGCTSLETVEVKGELTEIAADAFNGCTNLTGLTTAGGIQPLASSAAKSLAIPASVTKIGDRAFMGTGITAVTVPAGVQMGTGVFRNCKQLTKAAVEKGVKTLTSYTFKGCSALTSVTLPSGITTIQRSVFSGCKALKSVTIPKTVTSIGKNALYGASKVKTLTINSKKLTKSNVKGSLAGSKVTTVKVPKSMVSAYQKIFTKANCGKTVKVRAI